MCCGTDSEAALMTWQIIVFMRMCVCVCVGRALSFKCVATVFEDLTLTGGWVCISCWVMSQHCLYVCLWGCLCTIASWSFFLSALVLSQPPMETDRELETLGSRIWNMLMIWHNNNPSSHTPWKENEKLSKGFCLFPTLFDTKLKSSYPHLGQHLLLLRNCTCIRIVQATLRHQS